MGAIASGGVIVRNEEVFRMLRISEDDLQQVAEREQLEMLRRERAYLGHRPRPLIAGRTVIVVDDGMATGSTMQAAVLALRQSGAGRIIVAVPTASHQACALLRDVVDECICLSQPQPYYAVGQSYLSFPQTSDAEVTALLDEAAKRTAERGPSADQR
jgi:predicted phosphoribosyltransferase